MIESDLLVAEWEALRTVKLFFQLIDAHDGEGAAALMHPDVVWFRQGQKVEGVAAVRDVLSGRSEGLTVRHLVTNAIATASDVDDVTCSYCILSYLHNGAPGNTAAPTTPRPSIFDCTDRLRKHGYHWRFIYKDAVPVFLRAKE